MNYVNALNEIDERALYLNSPIWVKLATSAVKEFGYPATHEGYSDAVYDLLLDPISGSGGLMSRLTGTKPFILSIKTDKLRKTIEERDNTYVTVLYEKFLHKKLDKIIAHINSLIKNKANEHISEELEILQADLRSGNLAARVSLFVVALQTYVFRNNFSQSESVISYTVAAAKLSIEAGYPFVDGFTLEPRFLTRDFLEAIDQYGLRKYFYVYGFFNTSASKKVGETYATYCVGWRGKPSEKEVTTVAYSHRELEWNRKGRDYERQQQNVIRELASIAEASGLAAYEKAEWPEKDSCWDLEWILNSSENGSLPSRLASMLSHSELEKILSYDHDYSFSGGYNQATSSDRKSARDCKNALHVLMDFAFENPGDRLTYIKILLRRHYDFVSSIYNLDS